MYLGIPRGFRPIAKGFMPKSPEEISELHYTVGDHYSKEFGAAMPHYELTREILRILEERKAALLRNRIEHLDVRALMDLDAHNRSEHERTMREEEARISADQRKLQLNELAPPATGLVFMEDARLKKSEEKRKK